MNMIDFLKSKRLFTKACERFMEDPILLSSSFYKKKGDIAAALYHFRHYTLHDAFSWEDTPEGHDYWKAVQEEYEILMKGDINFAEDEYPENRWEKLGLKWDKDKPRHKFDYVYVPKPIDPNTNPSLKILSGRGFKRKTLGEIPLDNFKNPEYNVFEDKETFLMSMLKEKLYYKLRRESTKYYTES